MRYYPSLEYDDKVNFITKELKVAVIEKSHRVKKGKFLPTRLKRKVTLVLEVPINGQEPVYMDVVTGEVFDTYETLQNNPNRRECADGYIVLLSEDFLDMKDRLVSQNIILETLYDIHRDEKKKWGLTTDPCHYMKDDGFDLLCYELEESDTKMEEEELLSTEVVGRLIEEDVWTLRNIVENDCYLETKDLYCAHCVKTGEPVVVYPAIMLGYNNYLTHPDMLSLKGEYSVSDLTDIAPFYTTFQEEKLYPILTPSLEHQLMREHWKQKKQKIIR